MRLALYQNDASLADPAARFLALERIARDLSGRADLLLASELLLSGYAIAREQHHARAEPIPGPATERLAALARSTGMAIVCGLPERDGDTIYNTAVAVSSAGGMLARHRKLHLPPGFETGTFQRGNALTLFELMGMRIGLLICYDVEFPESVRALASRGADLAVVPTALARDWGRLTTTLVPTRAFENGLYLAYANHAGIEHDFVFAGQSCIIGPDGLDVARAGTGEEVLQVRLDPAAVAAARKRLPYLTDLRRDVLA